MGAYISYIKNYDYETLLDNSVCVLGGIVLVIGISNMFTETKCYSNLIRLYK